MLSLYTRTSSRSSSASANDSVGTTASSTSFAQGGETGSANAAPVTSVATALDVTASAILKSKLDEDTQADQVTTSSRYRIRVSNSDPRP